jgi:Glycosyl hydrolases family 38 N-terminal domain./Glycosyl hydrolases family 38 C-terminal domain.
MNLRKNWKIFLIHHSHTDIGYTERQDKIIRYHCDYIRQAIDILNNLHYNNKKETNGFVWQCENYWQVKNFYEQASESYKKDFEKYVKSEEIGLSGNYLNLTELISYDVLFSRLAQAKNYGDSIGVPVKSGMTADINGFAWGYADALAGNGIENLFSCLHPHHGMFPLYKKQIPFYWQGPKGKKVLVWNGEHYHFGNELYFAPHAGSSYLLFDEIHQKSDAHQLLTKDAADTAEVEFSIFSERIERYLRNLEDEGYPYDFVPFMVSGCITDNAPPSELIAERAAQINEKFAGQLHVEMTTLDHFFAHVRGSCADIPVYSGDWNDWWADGVGSTPAVVKNFRDAQRKYDLCKKFDPDCKLGNADDIESAAENLTFYAEHTWGYSSSVSEPWETLVGDLELKKSAYAINANTDICRNLDRILESKGEVSITREKLQRYKIINPHNIPCRTTAVAYIESWEFMDGIPFTADTPVEVVDEKSGEIYKSQAKPVARGTHVEFLVGLKPGEEKTVRIRATHKDRNLTVKNHAYIGADGIEDVVQPGVFQENNACIETDWFKILFEQEIGITSITDKRDGRELLRSNTEYAPFSGVYEVTDIRTTPCDERRRMGRNRKNVSTRRYASKLSDIKVVENGDVYIAVQMDYQLEGTRFYQVFLKIYKDLPKIDAMVRIHKESVWEPENLYISLPFTAGENEVKWIDKTGCVIRPGIDQLPGSNGEFYMLQNGIVMEGESKSVVVAVKDTPLVIFGDLKAKPIRLCNGEDTELNRSTAYAWVMNNFWETNFKVDLGGFYEFAYSVTSIEKIPADKAIRLCEAQNEGVLSMYI